MSKKPSTAVFSGGVASYLQSMVSTG